MVDSDAVIAGMVGDNCFAYSYFLTAQEQCNYEGSQVRQALPPHTMTEPLAPAILASAWAQESLCRRQHADWVEEFFRG
jgi:hypothetical protein